MEALNLNDKKFLPLCIYSTLNTLQSWSISLLCINFSIRLSLRVKHQYGNIGSRRLKYKDSISNILGIPNFKTIVQLIQKIYHNLGGNMITEQYIYEEEIIKASDCYKKREKILDICIITFSYKIFSL